MLHLIVEARDKQIKHHYRRADSCFIRAFVAKNLFCVFIVFSVVNNLFIRKIREIRGQSFPSQCILPILLIP